uniref:Uncharacterized protein n=1 Tax=Kalanchoe fedtschenkoi TaxID=63787 RepID=A0A7N0TXR8_KALFE
MDVNGIKVSEVQIVEEQGDSCTSTASNMQTGFEHEYEGNENASSGGGLLDGLISSLAPLVGDQSTDTKASTVKAELFGVENGEAMNFVDEEDAGGGSGGGSIVDNIVSHLPLTLSDDALPATDEASILIHSIVHE